MTSRRGGGGTEDDPGRDRERKPQLAALCDELRRATEEATGPRRRQLEQELVALSLDLRDRWTPDATEEEAAGLRARLVAAGWL